MIPLFIVLLPFLPVKYLRYCFVFPILLPITWIILGKCPLTTNEDNEQGGFIHLKLKTIWPTITPKISENVTTFVLIFIVIVSALKIMIKKQIYKNK